MKFIFRVLSKFLSRWNIYIVKSLAFDPGRERQLPVNFDYVRYKTFELCCNEIKVRGIKGNVAELGVYKGDSAIKINDLFPDRKLYLFDTFNGFNHSDIEKDSVSFSTENQDFSDTSVELVLKRMKHPEMCVVKKGYFPETAADIDDSFCFVSIDADLFEPIIAGLNYFYPRLELNGFIFIHDFNNKLYKGSREAVVKYCKEHSIGFIPLPDDGGSAVIVKSKSDVI
jgi:O-methyltransferase